MFQKAVLHTVPLFAKSSSSLITAKTTKLMFAKRLAFYVKNEFGGDLWYEDF